MASIDTNYAIANATNTSAPSTDTTQQQTQARPEVFEANLREREAFMAQLDQSNADDDNKTRSMQRFFAQNDTTGSADGDSTHASMAKAGATMGLPSIGKGQAGMIATRVGGHPATKQMAQQVKLAMQGKGEMPSSTQLAKAASQALGDTGTFGASAGQPLGNLRAGTTTSGASSSKLSGAAAGTVGATAGTAAAAGADGTSSAGNASTGSSSSPSTSNGSSSSTGATDPNDPHNFKAVANAMRAGKLNPSQVATDVIGFVYAVMMQAQIDGNKDKREELNHTQMLNGMSDGLNDYMSNTLMTAQAQLSKLTANAKKGSDTGKLTVAIDPVPTDMDTAYAPLNTTTGKYQPMFTYGANGGRQAVTQTELSALIQQVSSWQTSIQNNQTKQTNRFQATDSAQTSNMNIINSLLKNVHDAVNNIEHNIQT